MIPNLGAKPVGEDSVTGPLLFECDLGGKVLWMSEETRAALGDTQNLVETIERVYRLLPKTNLAGMRVSRVWHAGTSVLLSVEPQPRDERCETTGGLFVVQTSLLGDYFRLQAAEQRIRERLHPGANTTTRLVRQIECERERLGRELHNGLGQMLAAIRLQRELLETRLPDPPAPVRQALDNIGTLAADALEQVRAISRRLHPPEWQRLTLEASLQQLWEISGIAEKFETTINIGRLPVQPDPEVKSVIYRSVQEVFSNLIRHSRAQRVSVTLAARGGAVVLGVADDGVGFNAEEVLSRPASIGSGIGLRLIREQTESVGGKFKVESGRAGTKIVISAPLSINSP